MHAAAGDGSQQGGSAEAAAAPEAGVAFTPGGCRLRVLSFNVNGLRACLKRLRLKTMAQLLNQLNAGEWETCHCARTKSGAGCCRQRCILHLEWRAGWAMLRNGLRRTPNVLSAHCLRPQTLCASRKQSCGGATLTLSWPAWTAGGWHGGTQIVVRWPCLPAPLCAAVRCCRRRPWLLCPHCSCGRAFPTPSLPASQSHSNRCPACLCSKQGLFLLL